MTNSTAVIPGAGIFQLVDTHGLPLQVVDLALAQMGLAYDVAGFVRAALDAGWSVKTIRSRLHEAVGDSGLSPADRIAVRGKVDLLLGVPSSG